MRDEAKIASSTPFDSIEITPIQRVTLRPHAGENLRTVPPNINYPKLPGMARSSVSMPVIAVPKQLLT